MSIRTTMNRGLCAMGLHDWLYIYEDEQEKMYSCRRDHGDDLCPDIFTVDKTAPLDEEDE